MNRFIASRSGRHLNCRASRLLTSMLLFAIAVVSSSGCYLPGLLGLAFLDFCEFPGNCGDSGNLLLPLGNSITELAPSGISGTWLTDVGVARGLAFDALRPELLPYVATSSGLRVYRGDYLEDTIRIPDCVHLADVVVLPDSDVVVTCLDSKRMVRIDPTSRQVVDSFSCCTGVDASFDPSAIALAPDGSLLSGRTKIHRFDSATGGFLGIAIEAFIGCDSDDHCNSAQSCEDGRCLPESGLCASDSTCGDDETCESGYCARLLCEDTCDYADNGDCNDGGLGVSSLCEVGTDCTDCGPRTEGPPRYEDLVFGPGGNLFVSRSDVGVLEFDSTTYEFLRVFVPVGRGGLINPRALAFDRTGNLFVAGHNGPYLFVLEFDGQTGEFVRDKLRTPELVGIFSIPSMVFRP